MGDATLRLAAQYLLYVLLLLLPGLLVLFSDRFRRQPEPGEYSVLFVLVAIIGVVAFVPTITVVALTALAALGLARLSSRYALHRLEFKRDIRPARLFPGEHADLVVELANRKLLPLAWLTVTDPVSAPPGRPGDRLHDALEISAGVDVLEAGGEGVVTRTALAPFGTLRRTYTLTARRRGVFRLGPAQLESGDPFGIYRTGRRNGESVELLVYPRVHHPEHLHLPFRELLGEAVARHALLEDPILLAGSRDYRPGDPLHRVHWKSTARSGSLKVRVADPSTTAQLMIVLNLNTYQHVWQGVDLDRMESVIEVAASVAIWALEHDYAVGLRSNGIAFGHELTPRLAPGAHPRMPNMVLEHLARLSFAGLYAAEDILFDEARRLSPGGSILFVTSTLSPGMIEHLTARRVRGRVGVVYCGRHAAPLVPGLPIHLSVPPGEARRAAS